MWSLFPDKAVDKLANSMSVLNHLELVLNYTFYIHLRAIECIYKPALNLITKEYHNTTTLIINSSVQIFILTHFLILYA